MYRMVQAQVQCHVCHQEFRDKQTLKRHLREVHERFRRGGSLKRGAEPEVRERCEKTRLNAQHRQLRIHVSKVGLGQCLAPAPVPGEGTQAWRPPPS